MEEGEPNREEIIDKGSAELRVHRKGMFQRIIFTLKRIKEPYGEYPMLSTDRIIDLKEQVRLAEELQIPVETPHAKVYPRGKSGNDFVPLLKQKEHHHDKSWEEMTGPSNGE